MVTIPLDATSSDFEKTVDIEDQTVTFRIRWNSLEEAWYTDITGVTFTLSLLGLKLVGGVNLIKPHAVIELGGLFLIDSEEKAEDPDYDLLGDRYRLIYVTKAEMSGITI